MGDMDSRLLLPDFVEFDNGGIDFVPDGFMSPMFLGDCMEEEFEMGVENIPRVPTTTPDYNAWALRLASRPLTTESTVMKGMDSGISGPFTYLYEQPYLPQTSPEMLALRFDKLTCGILSVSQVDLSKRILDVVALI